VCASRFTTFAQLETLNLEGNKNLRLQKEILSQGTAKTVAFLRELLAGSEKCYRMKLMLVGQDNVGKVGRPPPLSLVVATLFRCSKRNAITRRGEQTECNCRSDHGIADSRFSDRLIMQYIT
jgi:hypothetical protein